MGYGVSKMIIMVYSSLITLTKILEDKSFISTWLFG